MKITVRPDIITKAKQAGLPVRAFWLWHYAKHICKAGGTVPQDSLKDSLKALGISKTSRYDWINDAVRIGLLSLEVSNRTGLVYYRLASWADGAFIAGIERTGKPITLDLDRFILRSWQAEVWAGLLLQLRGRDKKIAKLSRDKNTGKAVLTVLERKAKPISRNTLTELTGVSRRAQQYREKKSGVEQVTNILIVRDNVAGFMKFGHNKDYPWLSVRAGAEVQHLPNTKAIPNRIQLLNSKSSTKRANKQLKALCKSDAIAESETFPRLYADSFNHALALQGDNVMYLTGKVIPNEQGKPNIRVWQRMQQHEK